MNKKLTPRYIIIAIILAWAIYALWPSLSYQRMTEDRKEVLREEGKLSAIESKIIKQGLDLKGGMYIVLEVDLPTLINGLAINKDTNLENTLNEVTAKLAEPEADFFNLFSSISEKNNLRLARYFHEYGASTEEIMTKLREESDDAINRVLEILQNRVDQFGVAEPTIQKQGNQRIIVELAGIQDSERARDLLQSTALLEFYLVKDAEITQDMLIRIDNILKGNEDYADISKELPEQAETPQEDSAYPITDDKTVTVSELFGDTDQPELVSTDTNAVVDQRLFEERPFSSLLRVWDRDIHVPESNVYAVNKILALPEVVALLESSNSKFALSNRSDELTDSNGEQLNIFRLYHLENEPELTGGVISEAKENIAGTGSDIAGQPVVFLEMNSDGSKQWSRITGANVGRRVAIVLDNKVHMAPNIIEKISGGGTRIQGFANLNEAKDIAIVLRAGALPVPVKIIEERIVGPSLGADSIKQGTRSVLIGLIIVMIFMLIYYKISGSIADFALAWNIILVLAILALLQATLTLPGIAALILTMGMSIDANVIIFERIREELRKGKTTRAAIDAGYNRALTTIIDANITTVIAALVLYQFGTGPIRGFATVLFWGIVISMFTAIFVTRTIFNTITSGKKFQNLNFLYLIKATKIKFMKQMRLGFIVSGVIILLGLGSLMLRGGPKLSIDFEGGTMVAVQFTHPMDVNDIRNSLSNVSLEGVNYDYSQQEIKHFGEPTNISVRVAKQEVEHGNIAQTVIDHLYKSFPESVPENSSDFILSIEKVGPKVGAELSGKVIMAILSALGLILIYISIRFEFKFALGAIAALAHDVLVTLGIFSLLGLEISLPIIAAFLTIVGYSLNDTIVIFDRIRENIKIYRRDDYTTIIDRSINESLSRTIITSLTTFFVVLILWLFGGEVIHNFAFAMMIGVIVGTYSSIYVASPIVSLLHKKQQK